MRREIQLLKIYMPYYSLVHNSSGEVLWNNRPEQNKSDGIRQLNYINIGNFEMFNVKQYACPTIASTFQ